MGDKTERSVTRPCPDPDCGGLAVRTYDYYNEEFRWRCGDCGVWWPKSDIMDKS